MHYNTSELCDIYLDQVDVLEPIMSNFGGRTSFGGSITTIKCHESKGLILDTLDEPGEGKVLLIDGGGSKRRALIDIEIAQLAFDQGWEGIVIYGCVRDVDALQHLSLGIQAIAAYPVLADDTTIGDLNIPVNFGGVTFLPNDFIYADSTGLILSPDPLELEAPSA